MGREDKLKSAHIVTTPVVIGEDRQDALVKSCLCATDAIGKNGQNALIKSCLPGQIHSCLRVTQAAF